MNINFTNPFELIQEARNVLIDIGLDYLSTSTSEAKAFNESILSVTVNKSYNADVQSDYVLSVQLTSKGFDIFFNHVLERAYQIGMDAEDVKNALSQKPLEADSTYTKKIYRVIPELEFMALEKEDK